MREPGGEQAARQHKESDEDAEERAKRKTAATLAAQARRRSFARKDSIFAPESECVESEAQGVGPSVASEVPKTPLAPRHDPPVKRAVSVWSLGIKKDGEGLLKQVWLLGGVGGS